MYTAIVTRVFTRPHPNADNLVLGLAHGYQVIVSKDTKDSELGVLFPPDGQLSEEFCKQNNLIKVIDPETGKIKGTFSEKRNIKAQNFRGEKSEGFWVPLSYFEFTGYDLSSLKEGDEFDKLNDIPICNKYQTPATLKALKANANNTQKLRKKNIRFPEHIDTSYYKKVSHSIKEGSIIHITEKLHGTSGRFGYIQEEVKLNPFKKFINKLIFGDDFVYNWDHYHGSRRVVFGEKRNIYDRIPFKTKLLMKIGLKEKPQVIDNDFYSDRYFREKHIERLINNLRKGEILYYEIVGYTNSGKLIMPAISTQSLSDKKMIKKYGDIMAYKYGCLEGTSKIYVYRITHVNEDGYVIDLPWDMVKRRCGELGVNHVPELTSKFIFDGNYDKLDHIVNNLTEGESTLDSSHIREGIVLRVESEKGVHFTKEKSHSFGVLEGYLKESDDFVDAEDAA